MSVGEPIDRVDGRLKVTGRATYTADQNVPGLVFGVLVTSAIAKGRVASIDIGAAERVPGTLAVLTHNSNLKLAKDPAQVDPKSPADRALQVLQDDRIFYGNQPIAIAVAETLEAAFEAADRVAVHYQVQKPSVTFSAGSSNAYVPKKMGGAGDPAESQRGTPAEALVRRRGSSKRDVLHTLSDSFAAGAARDHCGMGRSTKTHTLRYFAGYFRRP